MQIARVLTVLLIVVEGVSLTSAADAAATNIASKVEGDSLVHWSPGRASARRPNSAVPVPSPPADPMPPQLAILFSGAAYYRAQRFIDPTAC